MRARSQNLQCDDLEGEARGDELRDADRELLSHALGGHYQIVRLLGRGAVGVVYLARDVALHRVVAIKAIRCDLRTNPSARESFRREARMSAQLGHPNIVSLHSFHESADHMYMVMRYVHGESLAERLRRARPLSVDDTRRVLAELALALDYAHRQGIVHRDLKPENILLERDTGCPILADFGVATRRTWDPTPGDLRRAYGTPHFMSPEQAAGEVDVDGRSDLYALGVLGYYMLSGVLPFDGRSYAEITMKHLTEQAAPLSSVTRGVPKLLVAAIERCLMKEPARRWQRARDLHASLTAAPARTRRAWMGLSALRDALTVTAS